MRLPKPYRIKLGKGWMHATHIGLAEFNLPREHGKEGFYTIAEFALYSPEFGELEPGQPLSLISGPTWRRMGVGSVVAKSQYIFPFQNVF